MEGSRRFPSTCFLDPISDLQIGGSLSLTQARLFQNLKANQAQSQQKSLEKFKGMGGGSGGAGGCVRHSMMKACLVKGLMGVRTLSAWLVPQANSFHTYFLTDSTLSQKIHMVRLTRGGANMELEGFPVRLCQESSMSSMGLRGAGVRGVACDLGAPWKVGPWARVLK